MKRLLSLLFLLPGLGMGNPIRFEIEGTQLWIQNGVLDNAAIEQAAHLFTIHTFLDTIHLKHLRGDNPLYAHATLYQAFAFRKVEVHGACEGACAHLALSAQAPTLHPDATLTIRDQTRWTDLWFFWERQQQNVAWIAGRLPTVPRSVIEQSLMTRGAHRRQLELRPLGRAPGVIDVVFCDPAPTHCRRVRRLQPGESRLVVAPRPAPAASSAPAAPLTAAAASAPASPAR